MLIDNTLINLDNNINELANFCKVILNEDNLNCQNYQNNFLKILGPNDSKNLNLNEYGLNNNKKFTTNKEFIKIKKI